MNYLSLICIFFLATDHISFSQNRSVSGTVTYTATLRYSLFITGSPDKTDTGFLYFNDTSSAYFVNVFRNIDKKKIAAQISEIDPASKDELMAKISGINDKLKVNFDYRRNNTPAVSRQWISPKGDAFCMIDTIPEFNWVLLPDTLRILGFLCQKATCSTNILGSAMRKFTAWYTPDIPASYGPARFFGLPGLILQIDNTYYNYTAVLIRMPMQNNEITKLSPCSGLQTITKKQADEITAKTRTDLMNMQKLRENQ